MEGAVEGGGQGDCAFALLTQPRPKPSEIKNAQIFIGIAPQSLSPALTFMRACYFSSSQLAILRRARIIPHRASRMGARVRKIARSPRSGPTSNVRLAVAPACPAKPVDRVGP